jgi:uncharacterized protein (TIGR02145 family)
MKSKFIFVLFLISCCYNHAQVISQKVGNNPMIILPSAALEVESTTKGFLPPRMTKAQMKAIVNPAEGLIVYCTDCIPKCMHFYNGSNWYYFDVTTPGTLASLNCAAATSTGTLIGGIAASGVASTISYTGGNGGAYLAQSIPSTGVTGLTATLTAGTLAIGPGALTYTITGTPASSGTASFAISIGEQSCSFTRTVAIPASIVSLICAAATSNGVLIQQTAALNVSSVISYTGGNVGAYLAQSITSTGVTGLTATLTAGTVTSGNGNLTYAITGTPASIGTASFAISIGGQSCTLTRQVGIADRAYGQTINGFNNHNFVYFPVTGADGKTWLNNNLGAHYANVDHPSFNPTQQATSSTDHLAYGSLFQWGRAADGHELLTWTATTAIPINNTTPTLSSTDTAANALFITINAGNYDWRDSQNNNLWQGVNGTNNPCPTGFRVPTSAEFSALLTASSINNAATAASSILKFTTSGYRGNAVGLLYNLGSIGLYWSSSLFGINAIYCSINSASTIASNNGSRAIGSTVRCLKDY